MIFHKRPPQPTPTPAKWEFFTNLSSQGEFMDGHVLESKGSGCPLKSAQKKKEIQNMTTKADALRAEIDSLKNQEKRLAIDMVKRSVEHSQRMADAKRAGEEVKLAGDMKQWGIRFL